MLWLVKCDVIEWKEFTNEYLSLAYELSTSGLERGLMLVAGCYVSVYGLIHTRVDRTYLNCSNAAGIEVQFDR
jgi:hypothetical protein